MGNLCTCFAPKTVKKKKSTKRLPGNPQSVPNSSNRWTRIRSTRKDSTDSSIQEQALAAAILFRQHQQQNGSGSLPFDRSASLRYPNNSGSKKTQLPRSSSSRARSLTDPLLQPHQLVNQDIKLDDLETNHLVLVHGEALANSNDLMQQAQIFVYANGNGHPPTAIDLDKSLLRELLFNQSPAKDVALASVSMRPIPFAPALEKLCLSDMKYGTVRRFYIETPEDNAIPITLQESMINSSPPEKVYRLKVLDVGYGILKDIGNIVLDVGYGILKDIGNIVLDVGYGILKDIGNIGMHYSFAISDKEFLLVSRNLITRLRIQHGFGSFISSVLDVGYGILKDIGNIDKQTPAGVHGNLTNNYYRADGQNCGNFITDRPSTKVHAAPGGGSSLGYLFGGNGN
ncbi:hypothetical protein GH714_043680 [Hevea brasiliensis]|uniref:Uncharacterized protein n=1 Tax=Hevea brasiliensis TaxID=3981 RepID=A0A6A6K2G5_HEVBR|nr:hypothetical protein GH714_043680 [Hevea brasiliensis]